MAAEAEDPAEWLQANQARLPNVFRERLSFVAGLTSNFEAAGWLDPAQIASGGSRNEFPNTPPTQTALMSNMVAGKPEGAISKMAMSIQTVVPERPFTAEALQAMLGREGGLSEEDVAWLAENSVGFAPNRMKTALEDWLFDSFLASAQEVIPKLWLGGRAAAHDEAQIDAMGVSHVLCVGGNALAFGGEYEPPFPEKVTYQVVEVEDTDDPEQVALLKATFDSAIEFIDAGRGAGGVYVHCMAGASRSASTVCAFLMKRHGLSMDAALALVRSARPIANPNVGFIGMLQSL